MWEWQDRWLARRELCENCRIVGAQRYKAKHGEAKVVCAVTEAECAEDLKDPRPTFPRLPWEALEAWRLFNAASTQWEVGFSGPSRLRYEVLPQLVEMDPELDGLNLAAAFPYVRALEIERLDFINEKSEARRANKQGAR